MEICAQKQGNSIFGDLKCKNFLWEHASRPLLEGIAFGARQSLSGYLEIFASCLKSCGQPWRYVFAFHSVDLFSQF